MTEVRKCIHGRTEKQICVKCDRMDIIEGKILLLKIELQKLEDNQ